MRKKMVAANWKMNLLQADALHFLEAISKSHLIDFSALDAVIFPPSIYLEKMISRSPQGVQIGAQNFYFENNGPFTGEICLEQLKSINCSCVLIGHSERRIVFSETPQMISEKLNAAVKNGFNCILCIGESQSVRESGDHLLFLHAQLEESIGQLDENVIRNLSLAYEPVWAIGTGLTANLEQINEVHNFIRSYLLKHFPTIGGSLRILYGGSCNEQNAKEIFSCPNVDGGLIGGASLDCSKFLEIIRAAHEVSGIEH